MLRNLSFFSLEFFYFLGSIFLIIFLPPIILWGSSLPNFLYVGSTVVNSMVINSFFYTLSFIALSRIKKYPHKRPSIYIFPITINIFIFLLALITLTRIAYSLKIIVSALLAIIILLSLHHIIFHNRKKLNFLVVPLGNIKDLVSGPLLSFSLLSEPKIIDTQINGIVVDFRYPYLTPKWEQFISTCALNGLQVIDANQLNESVTGRVNIKHLVENNFGNLTPSPSLIILKRVIDFFIIFILLPIVIPIIFITIFFVCLDSEGGAFFKQARVGFKGKKFNILKFRSMYLQRRNNKNKLKNLEKHRITRVGAILRKYRIDELPQFLNVLKGDLSLIGPRPETLEWHKKYSQDIPFYTYRNIVKPGVTGWAQVMQGYVHGSEKTKLKLEYDLYYIKNFSLWLDLLIVYRTFKIILLGKVFSDDINNKVI